MKRTFCIGLILLLARCLSVSADTNGLCFFVVSAAPIKGGRFIDTAEFPKLGYISNAPNYVLTRLQEVWTNDVTSVSHFQGTVTTNIYPAVSLKMLPSEAEGFAEFTRQNINRRVVAALRGTLLVAPMIRAPIETGTLQLGPPKGRFPQSVIHSIQELARHE
jgi:preprotein translocase subunit SecD